MPDTRPADRGHHRHADPEPLRRRLTQSLAATIAVAAAPGGVARLWAAVARSSPPRWTAARRATLEAVGDAVLPAELGDTARREVVAAFVAWIADYRPEADPGHAYGGGPYRAAGEPAGEPSARTPPAAGPSARIAPAAIGSRYGADLAELDRVATREHGLTFGRLAPDARAALVRTVIDRLSITRLPARPDGTHVATDMLAFWCASGPAADLCYRARIGRDDCRGLAGSEDRPAPLR